MFIKAKKDLVILDPNNFYQKIPAEGIEVSDTNSYWVRRILAGDVEVIGENPLEKSQEKSDEKSESKSFKKNSRGE